MLGGEVEITAETPITPAQGMLYTADHLPVCLHKTDDRLHYFCVLGINYCTARHNRSLQQHTVDKSLILTCTSAVSDALCAAIIQ